MWTGIMRPVFTAFEYSRRRRMKRYPVRFWDTSNCLFQADGIAEDLCYRGHVPAQRLLEDVVRVREWRSVHASAGCRGMFEPAKRVSVRVSVNRGVQGLLCRLVSFSVQRKFSRIR